MRSSLILTLILFLILTLSSVYGIETLHHDISLSLDPQKGSLSAIDTLTLSKEFKTLGFIIHKDLNIEAVEGEKPKILKSEAVSEHLKYFLIEIPPDKRSITIRYSGVIKHPLDPEDLEMARGFRMTKGIISEDGVYLSRASGWYPIIEDRLVTFSLRIHLPEGWKSVSQGERVTHENYEIWKENNPQEEIFLIANRFVEYQKRYKEIKLMVFLRSPDDKLAERYLHATAKYLNIYENLIGDYPYKKFALVENFWETGLGMPSFTLLGPKIIRFPFIIDTSYPHEILHNWWGNAIYPDISEGNWSEGLTAYLSDHLFSEEKNEDWQYRMTTLQKYTDYVNENRDIPIRLFRMRHTPQEEAIGYGKTLMFFHMLRLKLGDSLFIEGLREFYKRYRFKYASFDDLRIAFEYVSNLDLKDEFEQWINRKGAPLIEFKETFIEDKRDSWFLLKIKLAQTQKEEPFSLRIPVRIFTEKGIQREVISMTKKEEEFSIQLSSRPLKIDIDPYFDVMRRLSRDEAPPTISQVLGAKNLEIIIPSKDLQKDIYKRLSEHIKISATGSIEIKEDSNIDLLPKDKSIIIFGWENKFLKELEILFPKYDISLTFDAVKILGNEIKKNNHSLVITLRNPFNKDYAILFISTKNPDVLGRKIPHYHKYSYLAFEEDGFTNILKGKWHIVDSPLSKNLSEKLISLSDDKKERLLNSLSIENMFQTISILSKEEMNGRKPKTEGFLRAQNYLLKRLKEFDLEPFIDEKGNIYTLIQGKSERCIVLGAHYDHIGRGYPGADDNASGVSVVLELANLMRRESLNFDFNKKILIVFFSEEEDGRVGSKFFVKNFKDIDKCDAMINLDTVGRLRDKNLLIIGSHSSEDWFNLLKKVSENLALSIDLVKEELDSSDNVSFEEIGIPAIQITSGPHPDYHKKTDTTEKIDKYGLLKIMNFTKGLIYELMEKELRFTKKTYHSKSVGTEKRRVSLGTIPDFTHKDKGFKIDDVLKESPAEKAGLKKGDIILSIDEIDINSVKDFADILKRYKPGDRIKIKILREDEDREVVVELIERFNP